jgi:histidine phosphotransfer protein HptB
MSRMNKDKIIVKIEEDIKDLIPRFLELRKSNFIEIKNELNKNNFVLIQETAHKIKGSSRLYGFEKLSEIAYEIELSAKNKDKINIEKMLSEAESHLANIDIKYI